MVAEITHRFLEEAAEITETPQKVEQDAAVDTVLEARRDVLLMTGVANAVMFLFI